MEGRAERLDLLHELVDEFLAGDAGIAGNVVDRLLGIEFGTLAAGLGQDVDEMAADVEQAELEDGEQPDRPRADDHDIRLDGAGVAQRLAVLVRHPALLSPDGPASRPSGRRAPGSP